MKKLLFILMLSVFAVACKSDGNNPATASVKILSANYWKLDRYTDVNGKTLGNNELNSQAQAIFDLEFEFREDNVTRGRDRVSKQIKNAGTWYLKSNNTIMEIQITGFGGDFKVIQLANTKLILQATNNQLISSNSTVNLELVPSL
ncbi:hypothetical protein [Emticicia sp. 21SJ11W-3]|uniref:hypothetical protein n=1 Tax=Emticicia sp. 21SJ11W-3 TaxID=2916755 RepID=UPI00209D2FCB|nr:hypothetical protein [Emticicia sp. 21SJ11W-3]UTA67210.1 hypothetical protein MB380_16570 [Emticicia sp. 21SJ11W-3]